MNRVLVVFLLCFSFYANAQTVLFSDDFDRSSAAMAGEHLDNGWMVDEVVIGDAGRSWQISPSASCEGDLRFASDNSCEHADGSSSNTTVVVYHEVNANGYDNLRVTFDWVSENMNFFIYDHEDRAELVYSVDGQTWVLAGGPYYGFFGNNSDSEDAALPGALNSTTFFIGFRVVNNDSNIGGGGFFSGDPGGNGIRLAIDNLEISGEGSGEVVGNWYLNSDVADPTNISNWYSESGKIQANSTDQFENAQNTFILAKGVWSNGTFLNASAGNYTMTDHFSVDQLVIPSFGGTGSTLNNSGYNLEIGTSIEISSLATLNFETINQGAGGSSKPTEPFPFAKLKGNELLGRIVLSSPDGEGFENVWDLTEDLDWSASGAIVNNGTWILEGGNSLALKRYGSVSSTSKTKIADADTYLNLIKEVEIQNEMEDHFVVESNPEVSGFVFNSGIEVDGVLELGKSAGVSVSGKVFLAEGAKVNLYGRNGIDFSRKLEILDLNGASGTQVVLQSDLALASGDTLSLEAELVAGETTKVDIGMGAQLWVQKGDVYEVNVASQGALVVEPGNGAFSHGALSIGHKGVMLCKNGSSCVQKEGSTIQIGAGPEPFSQGGDFIDLNVAKSSAYGSAPQIVASNNIGYTGYTQYTYWSSPTTAQPLGSIPQTVIFYEYNDMAEGDNGWAYTGGNFVPGRGYAFQQAGGDVVSFDGQANSGVVLGPLVGDNQIGTDDENWSFVGNPYPSGIHAGQLLAENEGVQGSIYIWDQSSFSEVFSFSTSDYTTVNFSGATGPVAEDYPAATNFYIAPFQGFFVEGIDDYTPENFVFTNAMRDTSLGADFEHSFKSDFDEKLWISLQEQDGDKPERTECLIAFIQGATPGWDRLYDATSNNDGLELTTVVPLLDDQGNKTGQKSAVIQGMPHREGTEIIDLELWINAPGTYEVNLDRQLGLLGQEVWIWRAATEEKVEISNQPFIVEAEQAGLVEVQLMFYEPGTSGIEDQLSKKLNLVERRGVWRANMSGEVMVVSLAGQVLESKQVRSGENFQISTQRGLLVFKAENGDFAKRLLR